MNNLQPPTGWTWSEIVTSILSVIAIVGGIFSYYRSGKANILSAKANSIAEEAINIARDANTLSLGSAQSREFQFIRQSVDSAKSDSETMMLEMAPLLALKKTFKKEEDVPQELLDELDYRGEILKAAEERLYNAYEDGCSKFYKGQLNHQDFVDCYHRDIFLYVERSPKRFNSTTSYKYMLEYYKQYHQNPKR